MSTLVDVLTGAALGLLVWSFTKDARALREIRKREKQK